MLTAPANVKLSPLRDHPQNSFTIRNPIGLVGISTVISELFLHHAPLDVDSHLYAIGLTKPPSKEMKCHGLSIKNL